jgi:hypothetical protein
MSNLCLLRHRLLAVAIAQKKRKIVQTATIVMTVIRNVCAIGMMETLTTAGEMKSSKRTTRKKNDHVHQLPSVPDWTTV